MVNCVEFIKKGNITIIDKDKAIERINNTNHNYKILSEFKGWREDITRECQLCGDIRTVKARSLIEKNKGKLRKCPVCAAIDRAKILRKSNEQFIEEMKNINNSIDILTEYITNSDKVKCKCKIDEFEWETTPHSLLDGHGCPECSRRNQNWRTSEQFIDEMKIKHPNITPTGDFTRVNDVMKFRCNICDYEWQTSPNSLLNRENYTCPKCSNHGRVSEKEMIDRLEKCNPKIKYISGYRGIAHRSIFKCLDCNNEWSTPVNSVLSGRGCPRCNLSHGALEIERVLKEINVDYEKEYRFEDCKDYRTLPFDFFIRSKNMCIEYDGEQHFMPVKFGKNQTVSQMQEKFELQQKRDKIKTEYCENNNINLIRISYTDFSNIESIINKCFS